MKKLFVLQIIVFTLFIFFVLIHKQRHPLIYAPTVPPQCPPGYILSSISNSCESVSNNLSTLLYNAHNIVGADGFSIEYPKGLTYKVSYTKDHRLETVRFYDPTGTEGNIKTLITVIYNPEVYESSHSAENNPADAFEVEPIVKPDGSVWQTYSAGGGNNGTPTVYIRKGNLALEMSLNLYFGNSNDEESLDYQYQDFFVNVDSLKFIKN